MFMARNDQAPIVCSLDQGLRLNLLAQGGDMDE